MIKFVLKIINLNGRNLQIRSKHWTTSASTQKCGTRFELSEFQLGTIKQTSNMRVNEPQICIVNQNLPNVCLLDDLSNGATMAQKIVASSVFSVTEILVIEDHKLNSTFLRVVFRSQSLLKLTGDQTDSDTN
jgi:hypothetical protein